MKNARKGLKRYGMRTWIVTGPITSILIEREHSRLFSIRHQYVPACFYMQKFRRLSQAREAAEAYAGIK